MRPNFLFVVVDGGYVAHKHTTTPASAKRIAENQFYFGETKCNMHGRMKLATDGVRLCSSCFKNYPNMLTVGDFKAKMSEEPKRPETVQTTLLGPESD